MINVTEIRVYMVKNDNMTDKELAEAIGTSPATLGRWFKRRDMPLSFAEKIIAVLKIPYENRTPIFFC